MKFPKREKMPKIFWANFWAFEKNPFLLGGQNDPQSRAVGQKKNSQKNSDKPRIILS